MYRRSGYQVGEENFGGRAEKSATDPLNSRMRVCSVKEKARL
jgi:hypothetical protein